MSWLIGGSGGCLWLSRQSEMNLQNNLSQVSPAGSKGSDRPKGWICPWQQGTELWS